jgi:hypothetical protein
MPSESNSHSAPIFASLLLSGLIAVAKIEHPVKFTVAEADFNQQHPDVIVAFFRGGDVAVNMLSQDTPVVPLWNRSEQFRWYDKLMADQSRKFVVTLYNERNGAIRVFGE